MNRADSEKVQADLEKMRAEMRTEIKGELVTLIEGQWGEQVITRILARGHERVAHLQKTAAAAVAEAEEAVKLKATTEQRTVELRAQIKELAEKRNDLQAAVDGLQAEYNVLLPKVEELRAEEQRHVSRVQKIAS